MSAQPEEPEDPDESPEDGGKMPLLDHLIELRQRLLYSVLGLLGAFFVCFYFAEPIFYFLASPLERILASTVDRPRMIFTALTEVFFTYVKVAFFAGAFISCPVFLTQIWLFVAPGLYRTEKKAFAPFLIATPVLFFIGGALVYFVIRSGPALVRRARSASSSERPPREARAAAKSRSRASAKVRLLQGLGWYS